MGEPSIDKGGQKGEKLLERAWDALLDAGVDGENARRLVAWMKEYILFHDRRHPQEMGMAEIQQYLGAQPFQNTVGRKTGDWILKYVRFHKLRHPEEMGGTRSRTIPDPSGGRSTGVGYAQAVGAYEQSLRCQPHNPEAHHDLGRVLYKLGDVDRAADHLEQAAGQCDLVHPWLSLATIIPGCPGASPERILEVRQAFARRLTDQAGMGQAERRPAVGADNRLRVGYLSSHFHLPHYMKPVWGLINQHDRTSFEVHLFSDSPAAAGLPGYVRHPHDRVHDTADLSNGELAERIREAGVQILVDLSGYSAPERLELFTRHVAPVTIAWFNAFATTGLPGFDYILGDERVVDDGEERFFSERILGLPVPQAAVCRALHPMPLERWVQAHLLDPPDSEDQVSPRVQIWPVCGLMMAVDLPWRQPTAAAADFVVPPGPLTVELAQAMIHRPCSRMLDLGTGSGMLALVAAADAETVVATDTNERALAFTQFNARLNQIQNVHCLAGDLFEPVATQRFELIVCNPPFVISPTRRYLFRDSGERGDAFCRRLIRAAVKHLEPGGFLQCTANVAHPTGRSWKADLEAWFDDLGCDVLVLVERTEDASDYAMNWILGTETKDQALGGQRYQAWTEYLEREGIEAVSYLLITLRRSAAGTHWIQIDDPPCQIVGPCGDELLRFFEWRTALSDPGRTADLLSRRLRLAPGIRIEQEYLMTADGLTLEHVRLKKTGGLRYPLAIHVNVARLLAGCDGSHTLRELVEDLSRALGADLDPTVAIALPVIGMLLERAVLV